MLSIIYPYRNRDKESVQNSLNSLKNQTVTHFKVYFVDYGSTPKTANEIKNICAQYSFVNYKYYYTQFQPWNKSKALNYIIRNLNTAFCLVADVDMIFHPRFIETAKNLQKPNSTVYFQVGFLTIDDLPEKVSIENFDNYRKSDYNATGISLFPVNILKEIGGFDEFYHFWGAEDTDMHVRIKNAGYEVEFYDEEVLLLHQWHPSFRSTETGELSKELQLSGIVQLNHQHLKHAIQYNTTKINREKWGECITSEELNELKKAPVNFVLDNEQRKIDHLLYVVMSGAMNGILKITIKKDPFQNSPKFKVKKLIGKKVPEYYTLKQINDKVLLHIISFYRDKPYTYKISKDLKEIEIAIKF